MVNNDHLGLILIINDNDTTLTAVWESHCEDDKAIYR